MQASALCEILAFIEAIINLIVGVALISLFIMTFNEILGRASDVASNHLATCMPFPTSDGGQSTTQGMSVIGGTSQSCTPGAPSIPSAYITKLTKNNNLKNNFNTFFMILLINNVIVPFFGRHIQSFLNFMKASEKSTSIAVCVTSAINQNLEEMQKGSNKRFYCNTEKPATEIGPYPHELPSTVQIGGGTNSSSGSSVGDDVAAKSATSGTGALLKNTAESGIQNKLKKFFENIYKNIDSNTKLILNLLNIIFGYVLYSLGAGCITKIIYSSAVLLTFLTFFLMIFGKFIPTLLNNESYFTAEIILGIISLVMMVTAVVLFRYIITHKSSIAPPASDSDSKQPNNTPTPQKGIQESTLTDYINSSCSTQKSDGFKTLFDLENYEVCMFWLAIMIFFIAAPAILTISRHGQNSEAAKTVFQYITKLGDSSLFMFAMLLLSVILLGFTSFGKTGQATLGVFIVIFYFIFLLIFNIIPIASFKGVILSWGKGYFTEICEKATAQEIADEKKDAKEGEEAAQQDKKNIAETERLERENVQLAKELEDYKRQLDDRNKTWSEKAVDKLSAAKRKVKAVTVDPLYNVGKVTGSAVMKAAQSAADAVERQKIRQNLPLSDVLINNSKNSPSKSQNEFPPSSNKLASTSTRSTMLDARAV